MIFNNRIKNYCEINHDQQIQLLFKELSMFLQDYQLLGHRLVYSSFNGECNGRYDFTFRNYDNYQEIRLTLDIDVIERSRRGRGRC